MLLRKVQEAATGYVFLLPAIALFGVFVFYPLVKTAYLGFYAQPVFPGLPTRYVGFSQYTSVLSSSEFLGDLWRTVLFVLFTMPLGIVLGLAMAVLAHKKLKGIRVFRTIFSSTIATSVAVASVIFVTLLDPQVGLLPYLFGQTGGTGILGSPTWALPAVALTTIWQNLGFTFILMSASLQSVPDELLEAAAVDGASPTASFWRVTFPLLSPQLFFVSVIGIIGGFQAFGQIDILTQGGPSNHTTTVLYDIYESVFEYSNSGKGAVMAIALFVILLALTAVQFLVLQRRVFYAGAGR
ncbi:MAG TPA: sugar ABC transporter permease [Acidimicrobiales bacterium]|nr:sugar ABC transporter permease [Acidimicrobiales bacterium]